MRFIAKNCSRCRRTSMKPSAITLASWRSSGRTNALTQRVAEAALGIGAVGLEVPQFVVSIRSLTLIAAARLLGLGSADPHSSIPMGSMNIRRAVSFGSHA